MHLQQRFIDNVKSSILRTCKQIEKKKKTGFLFYFINAMSTIFSQ